MDVAERSFKGHFVFVLFVAASFRWQGMHKGKKTSTGHRDMFYIKNFNDVLVRT
jgi:hypothetical protein